MGVARPAGRQPCKLKLFRRGGACKQNPCTAQCTLAGPGPLRARAALASTVAKDLSTSMQNRRWCTHAFHHIHSHKGNRHTHYFGKRRGSSAGHPIYKAFAARVIHGSSILQSVCCAGHPRVILFTRRLMRGSSAGHPFYKAFAARVVHGSSYLLGRASDLLVRITC